MGSKPIKFEQKITRCEKWFEEWFDKWFGK